MVSPAGSDRTGSDRLRLTVFVCSGISGSLFTDGGRKQRWSSGSVLLGRCRVVLLVPGLIKCLFPWQRSWFCFVVLKSLVDVFGSERRFWTSDPTRSSRHRLLNIAEVLLDPINLGLEVWTGGHSRTRWSGSVQMDLVLVGRTSPDLSAGSVLLFGSER